MQSSGSSKGRKCGDGVFKRSQKAGPLLLTGVMGRAGEECALEQTLGWLGGWVAESQEEVGQVYGSGVGREACGFTGGGFRGKERRILGRRERGAYSPEL